MYKVYSVIWILPSFFSIKSLCYIQSSILNAEHSLNVLHLLMRCVFDVLVCDYDIALWNQVW